MIDTKQIPLDINKASYGIFEVKENDINSRYFQFKLTLNGQVCDLTGNTVTLYITKPSMSTPIFLNCEMIDTINGICGVLLTTSCVSTVEALQCELVIYAGSNEVISSRTFQINVLKSFQDDSAVQATNDFTALTVAMSKVSNLTTTGDGSKFLADDGLYKTVSGGGSSFSGNATDVNVDTSGFNKNLTSSENTVQKALDKIDDLNISSGGGSGINQVQSNWNETDNTQVDFINNKPNLATVATTGNYNDLADKPIIPSAITKTSQLTNDSNFVSDASYIHTDNNYSTADKIKLGGITANATNVTSSTTNGNIKINETETTVYILPNTVTNQGNIFNGASQLVQLDVNGKYPALDGSNITNLPSGNSYTLPVATSSTLGGVMQSTGVSIAINGAISVSNPITKGSGIIPTTGWVTNTGNYVYKLDYAITSILFTDIVNVAIDKDSQTVAQTAQFSASTDSYTGGVTFYCNTIPLANIPFSYIVIGG